MPFVRDEETYQIFHVKVRGYRGGKSWHCGGCLAFIDEEITKVFLCDFIVGARGKTCDVKLCWECALIGAIRTFIDAAGDRDVFCFCPKHFNTFIETGKESQNETD